MSNATQTAANVTTGTSMAMGTGTASMPFFDWVTSNSIVIGICLTIISILIALFFHVLNYKLNKKYKRMEFINSLRQDGLNDTEIERILKMSEG